MADAILNHSRSFIHSFSTPHTETATDHLVVTLEQVSALVQAMSNLDFSSQSERVWQAYIWSLSDLIGKMHEAVDQVSKQ